ncbi:MAG: hypothetical protein IE890_03570 [Arcobacter sp.]|nr:hypothetical protein [Arcobacter sp.]
MKNFEFSYIYTNNFKQRIQRNFKIRYKSNHLITKITFDIESIDYDLNLKQEWISSKKNYGLTSIDEKFLNENEEKAILLMIYDINPSFFTNDCLYSGDKTMLDKLLKIKEEYNYLTR